MTAKTDSGQRIEKALELILAAHSLSRSAFARKEDRLPRAHFEVLAVLRDAGPSRVGVLAHMCRLSQPGATRVIHRPESDGLVIRCAHPHDSRVSTISITEHGVERLDARRRDLRDSLGPMLGPLTDEEWTHLAAAARILTRAKSAEEGGPDDPFV